MTLKKYQQKRKFGKTTEPRGKIGEAKKDGHIFVVQEHHASHLHWDLRLEMNGVLKSWAIPKTPPLRSGIKRLAVQVEDHPLDYAKFKGTIPEGEYGAGKVEIWDKGTWKIENRESKIENEKALEIVFYGDKLKGEYVLFHLGKPKKNGWLFFKVSTNQHE